MSTGIRLAILAVTTVLYSVPVWSLGLGDARVQSFIGQPLEIQIDLLTSPGDDLGSVSARLASAEDFALIGASRQAIGVPLAFNVREGDGGGGAYILVTSRLAVGNPVLRLVVEVNWSSGRLLREYTIFLDPPSVPSQAPAPQVSQSGGAPPPRQSPADSAPAVQQNEPEPAASSAPPPAVAQAGGDADQQPGSSSMQADASRETSSEGAVNPQDGSSSERYGPVQSGQTLWQIATTELGRSGYDMNQVMVAIQRKNPNAFVNDNINLLMRGATLELPTVTEIGELSSAEARELVAQQEAAFRMRSSLASSSTPLLASESVADSSDAGSTVPDKQASETETSGASAEEEAVARLEIVPASDEDLAAAEPGTGSVPGGDGSDEVTGDIREELARTEEALISAQQENVYLQERIAELEAQLGEADEASSGGVIADEELADLEERLQAERLAGEEGGAAAEAADNQVPKVVPLDSSESDRPWYSGPMIWIVMVIILLAAIVGWIFNRRRAVDHYEADEEPSAVAVTGLKDEAEDILRALDSDPEHDSEAGESGADEESDQGGEDIDTAKDQQADHPAAVEDDGGVPADEAVPIPIEPEKPRRNYQQDHGDATVLDENSSDPEIQLDLARAYISMGDKEAARAILDEVLNLGNEEQKSEARSMMEKI